jgi:hypothetical protein
MCQCAANAPVRVSGEARRSYLPEGWGRELRTRILSAPLGNHLCRKLSRMSPWWNQKSSTRSHSVAADDVMPTALRVDEATRAARLSAQAACGATPGAVRRSVLTPCHTRLIAGQWVKLCGDQQIAGISRHVSAHPAGRLFGCLCIDHSQRGGGGGGPIGIVMLRICEIRAPCAGVCPSVRAPHKLALRKLASALRADGTAWRGAARRVHRMVCTATPPRGDGASQANAASETLEGRDPAGAASPVDSSTAIQVRALGYAATPAARVHHPTRRWRVKMPLLPSFVLPGREQGPMRLLLRRR